MLGTVMLLYGTGTCAAAIDKLLSYIRTAAAVIMIIDSGVYFRRWYEHTDVSLNIIIENLFIE